MELFLHIINYFKLLIERHSKDSMKQKDIFSWAIYIEIGLFIGMIFVLLKHLQTEFSEMLDVISYIFYNKESDLIVQLNFYDIKMLLKISFVGVIPAFIALWLFKFKMRRINIIIICEIFQIILFFILFKDIRYILLLMVAIGILTNIFFPFGTGFYFNIIKYMTYITDIYEFDLPIKKNWRRYIISLIVCCVFFVIFIKALFPVLSIKLLILLYVSIVLLLWVNSSKDKTKNYLKKILVYAFFVPFVLLSNNLFELSVQNIILVIISIFFAIDRIISLFNLLIEKIKCESIRYVLEEQIDTDYFIKQRIVFDNELKSCISEELLIRQIVIYFKLNLSEVKTLINIYKEKGYKKHGMLIGSIDYFVNSNDTLSLEDRKEQLSKFFIVNKRDIVFLPFLEEYAMVLYMLKTDYPLIVKLLEERWLLLSDQSKYILYYSYLQTNNHEIANNVKKEIDKFEEVESEMSLLIENL